MIQADHVLRVQAVSQLFQYSMIRRMELRMIRSKDVLYFLAHEFIGVFRSHHSDWFVMTALYCASAVNYMHTLICRRVNFCCFLLCWGILFHKCIIKFTKCDYKSLTRAFTKWYVIVCQVQLFFLLLFEIKMPLCLWLIYNISFNSLFQYSSSYYYYCI